ncbi:MAG: 2-hydroxyacid dehydrogenase [Pseudooceanicola sp.]
MVNVLFAAGDFRWGQYEAPLRRALADAGIPDVTLTCDLPHEQVDFIIFAPNGPISDFAPYTNAKAVLGLWAGVESIVTNPTLTQPLTRMVDDGLRQGMIEWVCGHVLRHHLGIDRMLAHQNGIWDPQVPPLAQGRRIGLLGLGALGTACGQALAQLGFPVAGWSRRPREITGVACHHGAAGLNVVLARSDILILLLPLTKDTNSLIDARALAQLPQGAVILNPGRGALIDDQALLEALDRGDIAHATLDTFRQEPLPADHPFWGHAKVTVSPHVASETRAETAAAVIAENIRRGLAGEAYLHLVDRAAGY